MKKFQYLPFNRRSPEPEIWALSNEPTGNDYAAVREVMDDLNRLGDQGYRVVAGELCQRVGHDFRVNLLMERETEVIVLPAPGQEVVRVAEPVIPIDERIIFPDGWTLAQISTMLKQPISRVKKWASRMDDLRLPVSLRKHAEAFVPMNVADRSQYEVWKATCLPVLLRGGKRTKPESDEAAGG